MHNGRHTPPGKPVASIIPNAEIIFRPILASNRPPIAGGFFMAIGAAQMVLVLALAMLMAGSDLRRGLAGFYPLFIGLTVFSIAGGSMGLAWPRIVPVAAFAVLQTALIWTAAGGHFLPDAGQRVYGAVGGYMLARPRKTRTAARSANSRNASRRAARSACSSLAVHTFEARAFCPDALNLLALENRQDLQFGRPWNFRNLEEGHRCLQSQGYRFVLLDTRAAAPDVPEDKLQEPTSRLTADMIRRSRENRAGRSRLERGEQVPPGRTPRS